MRHELKRTLSPQGLAEQFYAQGYQALRGGESLVAARFFALQLVVAPKEERVWVGLGAAHEQLGQQRKAAAVYRLGAARIKDSVWLNIGLGRAARRLGRAQEAERAFDRAEQLCGDPALSAVIAEQRESEE